MPDTDSVPEGPLVLYDGECGFCNKSVRFIIRHDAKGRVAFAPLQSELGQSLMARHGFDADYRDSMLLLESGADVRLERGGVAQRRGTWIGLGGGLRLGDGCPGPLRDCVYRLIARYRNALPGKGAACSIPTLEERARFVA